MIRLEVLVDILVLIEKAVHLLKFLLIQVCIHVAIAAADSTPLHIAVRVSISITIREVPISIHVSRFELILSAHKRGGIFPHFLTHRGMLGEELIEILMWF